MIRQLSPLLATGINNNFGFESHQVLGSLVEKIWQDVGCNVSRDRVTRLVLEEADCFQGLDAVKFASGLVHRRVRVRLIEEVL